MGILDRFVKKDPTTEIQKILPVAECSIECEGCDAADFPRSVSLKIEHNAPLWNSGMATDQHFLIATGKSDWVHNISDVKNSIAQVIPTDISRLESIAGTFKFSNSSLPLPADSWDRVDEGEDAEERTDVLILPKFVTIKSMTPKTFFADVEHVFSADIVAETGEKPLKLPSGNLVERSYALGYILLCSHNTRDRRCGITAPLMKKEFEKELREHDLYRDASDDRPGGVPVVYINHVGGHKLSANVLIYLKTGEMIWLARCTPKHCRAIVEECVLKGKTFADYTRAVGKGKAVEW